MLNLRKKYQYDLIVIGSGAGGSVGAHYARSLDKKVAIVEKGKVGGECPNIGCVPTKALLHAADVYELLQSAPNYGVHPGKITVNYYKIKAWKDQAVARTGAAHGEESLRESGIALIKGEAKFISPHEIEVKHHNESQIFSASKFLLATGSQVFIPPIPGLQETGYVTFEQAIDYDRLPDSIFILGGGPIGCEFAQLFSTFGTKVIIADTLPRILARDDVEVSQLIQALFEQRGITVLTSITVTEVEKKANKKIIHLLKDHDQYQFSVSEIMIATGKRPVLSFDPEKAGLKINQGRLEVNRYLQTNIPHIYAAGDLVGPYLFTHTGYYQSALAVHNMFSRHKIPVDYTVVPRVTFVKPEAASVGISEEQAKEQGLKINRGVCPLSILGRANTTDSFDGFVKIITDHKHRIIGGSIVSPHAGEMIHEIALAIKLKAKAEDLAEMIHAYPTYSEAIKIACSNLE